MKPFLLLTFLACSTFLAAQNLTVRVEGIRSADGHVRLGFYYTEADFKSKKSNFQRHLPKRNLHNGVMTVTLTDVPAGVYGVACVDDENDSGEMDWGLILPKEGFGFSNYYHSGISKPPFERFKFTHGPGDTKITLQLRYL